MFYLVAGGASAATLGPWLVLVLLGCGLAELALELGPRHRQGTQLPGLAVAPMLAAGASAAGSCCRWPGSRSRSGPCPTAAGSSSSR